MPVSEDDDDMTEDLKYTIMITSVTRIQQQGFDSKFSLNSIPSSNIYCSKPKSLCIIRMQGKGSLMSMSSLNKHFIKICKEIDNKIITTSLLPCLVNVKLGARYSKL